MRWLGRAGPGDGAVAGPTAESSANRSPAVRRRPSRNAAQRLEPRVDVVVGMVVDALVEPAAADDAQARAVRPAQRRDRLGQLDRLADRRLEVQLVVVGQAQRRRARRRSASGRPVARSSDGRYSSCDAGRRPGTVMSRRQRLHSSCEGRRAGRACARIPRFVRSEADAAVDRLGEAQVLAEVDARRRRPRRSGRRRARRPAGRRRSRRAARRRGRPRSPRVAGRLGRLVLPAARLAAVRRRRRRASAAIAARRSSSRAMPFLMLWSVLTTSPSSPTSTLTAYSSAPRRISSASRARRR